MTTSGFICKKCGAESPVGIGYRGQPMRPEPAEGCENLHVVSAWSLIGEQGRFRIQGGRAEYEAVMRNDATARSERSVRLARLVTEVEDGRPVLRQINRWVDADTRIEVLP